VRAANRFGLKPAPRLPASVRTHPTQRAAPGWHHPGVAQERSKRKTQLTPATPAEIERIKKERGIEDLDQDPPGTETVDAPEWLEGAASEALARGLRDSYATVKEAAEALRQNARRAGP
jgi:hypothetical protein